MRGGRIAALAGFGDRLDGAVLAELPAHEVLLPGLVDTHVHVNEPGRTEWEGFATATQAAAAGGVTTLVDMPLNSLPPTTSVAALRAKQAAAAPAAWVDVGFWGGAVPGSLPAIAGLHEAGVFGFKAFLTDSGVPEFGFLDAAHLDAVLAETARLGALLIVHAEDPAVIAAARARPAGRTRGSSPRAPPRRRTRRSRTCSPPPGGTARGCTSCTWPRRVRCRSSRRHGRTGSRCPPRRARTT